MLSKVKVSSYTHSVYGTDVEFFPVNFTMVSYLVENHLEDIKSVYAIFENGADDISDVVSKFPEVSAKLIALSAGEPEQVDTVIKMPFTDQVIILSKIYEMTIEGAGGLGKFMVFITNQMSKISTSMTELASKKKSKKITK